MKTKLLHKSRWLVVMLLVIMGTGGAMAQNPGDLPSSTTTQEVCVGTEPYAIEAGDDGNTLTWTISPGDAGVDWILTGQGNEEITVQWITPDTYFLSVVEVSTLPISCSTTQTVEVTVNPSPDAPISDGDIVECEENPIQTITATATVPAGHTVVWYDAAIGGAVVADPSLNIVGTVTYYAEASNDVSGCISEDRTAITLTITAAPDAPVSGGDITECEENPIQTITATATVPAGFTVVWYDAATGGNVVADPSLSAVGTVTYYAEAEDATGTCTSLTRTAVELTITAAPDAPVSGGDITECEENPIQTITATATVPAGFTVVWYDAATGGNVVADPSLSAVGTVTYYAEAEDATGTCTSLTRTAVELTITAAPEAPVSGGDITECEENPIQTITATATVPAGFTVVWYDAATGGNVVADPSLSAVGTVTYYAEAEDATGTCTSLTRTAVELTITAAPEAPVSGGDITECEENPIQTITATATVPAGFTVVWYDAATGGNVVADPSLSAVGTVTYYAEAEDATGTCTSLTRTAVVLTITPTPTTSPIWHN